MHSNLFVQALSFATVSEGYDSSCFDSDTAPSFYESLSKYPLLIITILVLEPIAPPWQTCVGGYVVSWSFYGCRWIHIKMTYMYVYAD